MSADSPPIGRDEAIAILQRLRRRDDRVTIRRMPIVIRTARISPDRVKALRMVTAEIEESVKRCKALESEAS